MDHLTSMQFATLLEGRASPELEREAARHFESCFECWEEWLLGLHVQAAEAQPDGHGSPVATSRATAPGVLVLPLFPVDNELDERAAAANAPTALPSLSTEDRSILVNFRRSRPDGPIRAFLVGSRESIPERVGLSFPEAGRSFEFNRGVAELPGITADQLREARLVLHLEELPDDPVESAGA